MSLEDKIAALTTSVDKLCVLLSAVPANLPIPPTAVADKVKSEVALAPVCETKKTEEPKPALSYREDILPKLTELSIAKGTASILRVLKIFGAANATQIPAERFEELLLAIEQEAA